MSYSDYRTTERITVLEVEVRNLKTTIEDMNDKLDDLLTLRAKGVGVFWIASTLFGTGIVGALTAFSHWLRGG